MRLRFLLLRLRSIRSAANTYTYITKSVSLSELPSQDNTGHFGPFQTCRYTAYYSFCGHEETVFRRSTWLIVAGVCAVCSVIALAAFCLFSVLHVAIQLQRREIMVTFPRAVFLKLITASVAGNLKCTKYVSDRKIARRKRAETCVAS